MGEFVIELSTWTAPWVPRCRRTTCEVCPTPAKGADLLVFADRAVLTAFRAGSQLVPVGTFHLQAVVICSRWCVRAAVPPVTGCSAHDLALAFCMQPFAPWSVVDEEGTCWALVYSKKSVPIHFRF